MTVKRGEVEVSRKLVKKENGYKNRKGLEAKKERKERRKVMQKVKRNSRNCKHLQIFWAAVWKNCYVRLQHICLNNGIGFDKLRQHDRFCALRVLGKKGKSF